MAEDPTLESLAEEERAIRLDRFDYDFSWALGTHMRETAAAGGLPVAIEITHGLARVFSALLPGATADNCDWVRRKVAVVERFRHSSLYMRLAAEREGVDFNARYHLAPVDFTASGGGVPLFVNNAGLVGVAAVSGLADVEDHRLVVASLRAVAGLA